MSRSKLIRILCTALVASVLLLALILVVAVIGGMTAEGPVAESDAPNFQPFFPEGSFDIGDITFDPEDFTRDPDATRDPDETRPPEPDVTLPDWESGWEWPTLPPSLETDPDFEMPTLPSDWDTLPADWDTLPPEWGDQLDPDDLADLLAGMDGSLGLPPGALAAGVASQLTVMEIYAEKNDTLYLKMQSFGDYTGQEWSEAGAYGGAMGTDPFVYSALYVPHMLMDEITPFSGYPLTIMPTMDVRVIPYYITTEGDLYQIQTSDVKAVGAYDAPYTLYYRPYSTHVYAPLAEASVAEFEADYAEFVERCYLEVDDTTMAYLRLIIKQQGFDKNDPDIVEKVAAYIQNAAVYNLNYNQNLDQEPNVALAFLGAYKEGVCRHFATAATLLYRALGIPARYTVGFMTDVSAYEITAVKGMDAHAWVEVYEEGFGWRFVEVTGSPANTDPITPPDTDTDTDTTPGTGGGTEPPVEPDDEPRTWGDLLAATDGRFSLSPSIPSSMQNSTVFRLYNDTDARLLLKLKSFGDYTGQGFAAAPSCPVSIYNTYSAAYIPGIYLATRIYDQSYTLRIESPMKTVAAPYYVSVLNASDYAVTVGDTRVTGDVQGSYELQYYLYNSSYTPKQPIATTPEDDLRAFAYESYLHLDDVTAGYLSVLLAEIEGEVGDLSDPATAIEAVAAYLREHYTLSTVYDTALDSEENVAVAFLDVYKEGSVRHFAAAATLIYRALGIPARYTVGYLAETSAGITATVEGSDAYAWVEVYVDGFGWMTVDVAQREWEESGSDITLKPVDMAVQYDGSTVFHSGVLEGFEAFEAKGYTYKADVQGNRTGCGVTYATIRSVSIYNPKGVDVTDRFRITTLTGVIHVYYTELVFAAANQSKVYDGTPLTTSDVALVSGELPEGYTVEFIPTGAQADVGVGYAAFDVVIRSESGNGNSVDCTSHFMIGKIYGTLTLTPAALTVKAADAEKVYDGEALTADGIELIGGSLAEGDYIDSYTVEGSQTRVGRSDNLITDIIIRNADGEDVTRNYAIETVAGTLRVTAP